MKLLRSAFPTPHDMILAYRKVKAEIWWMKTVPSLLMLAEYEANLETNLIRLRKRLLSRNFVPDEAFLGEVVLLPKKLIPSDTGTQAEDSKSIHYTVLTDNPKHAARTGETWEDLECRTMAIPSIDFQILGVLWTMEEGGDLDAQRSSSCRANVLRRNFLPDEDSEYPATEGTLRGPINKLYPGVFKPYFHAYKAWRNDGLEKAQEAVEGGQRVFALTLDLRRYFHQIDVRCLRTLFPPHGRIAKIFYQSLEVWQNMHGEAVQNGGEKLGIPVGLIASGVIANLILGPLDDAIEKNISPIYYGRYVDDLFLVFTLNGSFSTGESILKEIERLMPSAEQGEPSIKWFEPGSSEGGDKGLLKFHYEPWRASRFECKADKQRLFLLEGKPGRDLLAVIDRELKEHSSEWRMVPELDDDEDRWLKESLVASHDAAEGATTLRRADDLSIRRMGVTVAMRKLEAIERFGLKPAEWKTYRETLYRIAETHLLSPEGLCDFWPNLPRLFGLAFCNNDWSAANRLLTRIIEADAIFKRILSRKKKQVTVLRSWLFMVVREELFRACKSPPGQSEARRFIRRFEEKMDGEFPTDETFAIRIQDFKNRDMDRLGHKARIRSENGLSQKTFIRQIRQVGLFFQNEEPGSFPKSDLYSLLFPTRPLGEQEVCLKRPKASCSSRIMRKCLYALRGQSLFGASNTKKAGRDQPIHIRLASEFPGQSVRVAVTNFETVEKSWTARVHGKPDLSIERLRRVLFLIDDFLRTTKRHPWNERPLYFCFGELSIPREWLFVLTSYFSLARVSLIAGVEYEAGSRSGTLQNPAYLFLRNRNLGYPSTYVFRQHKTNPAPLEEQLLWQVGNYKLLGPKPSQLPIYVHGNFYFGVLLCSELTDAEIHRHFRGHVDALFCLEWNRDLETFSSLVESTAQTIHAYIVQVNNRLYGDSRIRAPFKEKYKRDLVRLRGGIHDYFVVGELPIQKLRDFQRKVHSDLGQSAPYKPLPSGYDPRNFERLHQEKDS